MGALALKETEKNIDKTKDELYQDACNYFSDGNNNALTICSLFNDRKDKLITAFNAAQVHHPKKVLTDGRFISGFLGTPAIML